MFEPVGARYDGPELEKGILGFWRRENVFGLLMSLNMLIEFGEAFDFTGAELDEHVQ